MLPCARRRISGFTLIELMIVVAIIGLLAAVALPNYSTFQLKTKTGEVKSNLAAIVTAEEAYFAEFGRYLAAAPEPAIIPGTHQTDFSYGAAGFSVLGFVPEGRVYFSYGVAITATAATLGYSVDAGADIDGNGVNQYWAYVKESSDGSRATASVGCDVSAVGLNSIVPCTSEAGRSVF